MRIGSLSVALTLIVGCSWGQHPHIDVSAAIENGQVVFNIPFTEIRGIRGFEVREGEKTLWAVDLPFEKQQKIVYGVLPAKTEDELSKLDPTQTFPPVGQIPADIRGKSVTVLIRYSYWGGSIDASYSRSFEKTIAVPKE